MNQEKDKEKEKGEKEGKKWGNKLLRKSNGHNPIISKMKMKRASGVFPLPGSKENDSKPSNGDHPTHTNGNNDDSAVTKSERSDSLATPFGAPSEDKFVKTAVRGKRPRRFNEKNFTTVIESLKNDTYKSPCLTLSNKYLDKYAAEDLAQALVSNTS